MKKLRKLFAVALALATILAMALPAMAAPGDPKITLNLPDPVGATDQESGHTYKAYQVFDGTVAGSTISVTGWGADLVNTDTIISELQANSAFVTGDPAKNIFADATDAASVAKALSAYQNRDNEIATAFAKVLNSHVNQSGGTALTAGTGAEVDPGYYLIKDWGPKASDDDFISANILEVVKDVEVAPKGSKPVPTKEVTNAETAPERRAGYDTVAQEIGKKVYYTVEGTIPAYVDAFDTYFYEFEDHMSDGITFNQIESVVLHNGTHAVVATYAENTDYTVTRPDFTMENVSAGETPDQGGGTLKITFADLKAATNSKADPNSAGSNLKLSDTYHVFVVYSAIVNTSAIQGGIGNDNDVVINYSNDPNTDSKGTSEPDEASVFTGELDVEKVNAADNTVKLKDAEFVLKLGDKYATFDRVSEYKKDADGNQLYYQKTYTWDATNKKWTETVDKAAEVTEKDATIVNTGYDAEDADVKAANPTPTATDANPKVPVSDVQYYYPTTTKWNATTKKWETTCTDTLTTEANGTLDDTGYDAEEQAIKDANPKPNAPANKKGPKASTGDYILTGWVDQKANATTLVTTLDGEYKKIVVKGVATGNYVLEETKAPAGYDLPQNPNFPENIVITTGGTNDATFKMTSITLNDVGGNATTGVVEDTIENSNDLTLPSTGGIGTTIFYVVGSILLIGAGILLVSRRRMSAK